MSITIVSLIFVSCKRGHSSDYDNYIFTESKIGIQQSAKHNIAVVAGIVLSDIILKQVN